MTTDNRMSEPTAESVIAEEMVNAGAPLMHSRVEESVAVALRAHGLLSEGAPTEAQVEAVAKTLHETRNPWFGAYGDWGAAGFEVKKAFRESARAALAAATIPKPVLDPEKVAEVLLENAKSRYGGLLFEERAAARIAHALCEAYTEGKLTK